MVKMFKEKALTMDTIENQNDLDDAHPFRRDAATLET